MIFLRNLLLALLVFGLKAQAALPPIRVLSLDGGGVRGMISATVLARLESELNRPVSEIFDLIAGSSSGAVNALALVAPDIYNKPKFTAEQVVELYYEHARKIFSASMAHQVASAGGLLGPKYDSVGLKEVMLNYVGGLRLSQMLKPTLITGYSIPGETGVEFYSVDARRFALDKDCLVAEIAVASSSAPIYFDSSEVNFHWGKLDHVADGGLYTNSPSVIAYINATKLYPGRTIEVYSLGTGLIGHDELDRQLKGRGALAWIAPVIRHLLIGNSSADDSFLHRLLNEDGEQNYFRLDIDLAPEHRGLDNTSQENLEYLHLKGLEITRGKNFELMIKRLRG